MMIKQVWLEFQFIHKGKRRLSRRNGIYEDSIFSFFLRLAVGVSQKPLTSSFFVQSTTTYFKDFFPDFLKHNPFTEPEYYKYPYEHVSLDHMFFVYMCEERLEMLDYAEKRQMNIIDFSNWATNQALNYNDEVGRDVYSLSSMKYALPYIRNNEYPRNWNERCFHFDV